MAGIMSADAARRPPRAARGSGGRPALPLSRPILRRLRGIGAARAPAAGRPVPAAGPHGELGGVPRGRARRRAGGRTLPLPGRAGPGPPPPLPPPHAAAHAALAGPHLYRPLRATSSMTVAPPGRALYVDALAVDPRHRRRGVATALLHEAGRMATAGGLPAVA